MKKDELRSLHLDSAAHAKRAFRNFTLSQRVDQQRQSSSGPSSSDKAARLTATASTRATKHAKRAPPSSPKIYVAPGASVEDAQRLSINGQLDMLQSTGPGVALIIKKDEVEQIIQDNEIDLTDLLARMGNAQTGTQFYTSGASIENSIANQAKVDKFFNKYSAQSSGSEESDNADE
jgi:hypothetical protein